MAGRCLDRQVRNCWSFSHQDGESCLVQRGVGAPGREGLDRRPWRRLCHRLGQTKFGLMATDRKEQFVHAVNGIQFTFLLLL